MWKSPQEALGLAKTYEPLFHYFLYIPLKIRSLAGDLRLASRALPVEKVIIIDLAYNAFQAAGGVVYVQHGFQYSKSFSEF